MHDEKNLPSATFVSLDPTTMVEQHRGPDSIPRGAAATLKRELVDDELRGNYTTPDLMAAFVQLGGSERELESAVLTEAAARRDDLSPAGLTVVWSRLIHVQEELSEGEVRSWLTVDMIRGLAARAATWTRFSAIVLGDWARNPSATSDENGLAQFQIVKHPAEATAVLAQAMREDPHGAERLIERLDEKTVTTLATAVVDDASIPASVRVTLATRSGEAVKARARAMVVRELGVTDQILGQLAPGEADDPTRPDDRVSRPTVLRIAVAAAGLAFLIGAASDLGVLVGAVGAVAMFAAAWLVGRQRPGG